MVQDIDQVHKHREVSEPEGAADIRNQRDARKDDRGHFESLGELRFFGFIMIMRRHKVGGKYRVDNIGDHQ